MRSDIHTTRKVLCMKIDDYEVYEEGLEPMRRRFLVLW